MIYFDYSATSPLLPEVKNEIKRVMDLDFGNPSSLHTPGSLAKELMNEARIEVAKIIEASPLSLIFTSGGSESNNTVIRTFENCPIFVSSIEHPSVLQPAEAYGNPCIKIPVNKHGVIDLNFLESKLEETIKQNPRQKVLVSVMLANNEVGTIEPISAVADLIQKLKKEYKAKIYLHSDATQAVGKIPVSTADLKVDYLTFSSHKLGGPVGIGGLYVRPGSPFSPLIRGGAQENKRRAGTSNVLLASGFKIAAKKAIETLLNFAEVKKVRNYLAEEISSKIRNAKVITPIMNEREASLPNILNVAFPAAEGESTQLYLDLEGIAVSTGSACASGDLEPSHVMMAMYHDAEVAHGSVRFSLGLDTTKDDIDILMTKLPGIVTRIQDLSTLKQEKPNVRK